jgi:hypothetical protein
LEHLPPHSLRARRLPGSKNEVVSTEKKDQCEDDRCRCRIGCYGGSAGKHGKAAGQTADHDVPNAAALEPDCVNGTIDKCAQENIERGRGIQDPGRNENGKGKVQAKAG